MDEGIRREREEWLASRKPRQIPTDPVAARRYYEQRGMVDTPEYTALNLTSRRLSPEETARRQAKKRKASEVWVRVHIPGQRPQYVLQQKYRPSLKHERDKALYEVNKNRKVHIDTLKFGN